MIRPNPPTQSTLRKYGLNESLWYSMLADQRGICPICKRKFTNELRPVIDHLHVKNFKKMKPEQKRQYVRGLLCSYCNFRRVGKGITADHAYGIYRYLNAFEVKRSRSG